VVGAATSARRLQRVGRRGRGLEHALGTEHKAGRRRPEQVLEMDFCRAPKTVKLVKRAVAPLLSGECACARVRAHTRADPADSDAPAQGCTLAHETETGIAERASCFVLE
jgi:hypothetical protein